MQTKRGQVFGRQNGNHSVQCHRSVEVLIDTTFGMGIGRAHEIAVQHARQFDVVDIIAFALGEPGIFNALAFATHTRRVRRRVLRG